MVKAGVCKTPIPGSNPGVASNILDTRAASDGPLSSFLSSAVAIVLQSFQGEMMRFEVQRPSQNWRFSLYNTKRIAKCLEAGFEDGPASSRLPQALLARRGFVS